MKNKNKIFLMIAILLLPAAYWWLFGWITETYADGEVKTFNRYFGRYTSVSIDVNQDSTIDAIAHYNWSYPYLRNYHVDGYCVGRWKEIWEDRNFDGKWDLWILNLRLNDDGKCMAKYSVDLDSDEIADWEFVAEQNENSYAKIVEKRGY